MSAGATKEEERPQGMFAVHKLPVWNEKGGGDWGGGDMGLGEDLAFTLSRRRFVVSKFSLPPVEGDQEAQAEAMGGNMPKKADLEF
jgi:elongator complex protein 4